MVILGLTGSIGMGKSEAARMLRGLDVPVFDADETVHRLLGPGGAAVPAVEQAFPEAVRDGRVDREILGRLAFAGGEALRRLEAILHPLVREAERDFLRRAEREKKPLVVLDVPLLFESGGERRCDATIVVSAPATVQKERVLERPGMTETRLSAILARQMPDAEKRRRADFVVSTGGGKDATLRQLRDILTQMRRRGAGEASVRRGRGRRDA